MSVEARPTGPNNWTALIATAVLQHWATFMQHHFFKLQFVFSQATICIHCICQLTIPQDSNNSEDWDKDWVADERGRELF